MLMNCSKLSALLDTDCMCSGDGHVMCCVYHVTADHWISVLCVHVYLIAVTVVQ